MPCRIPYENASRTGVRILPTDYLVPSITHANHLILTTSSSGGGEGSQIDMVYRDEGAQINF